MKTDIKGIVTAIPKRLPLVSALLWEIDTITVRFLMALASLIFAAFLMLSAHSMSPKAYDLMEWVGPRWMWSAIFVGYGVITVKLIWDDTKKGIHRARSNLWTNLYGFVIWAFCLLSVWWSTGYLPPLMSIYFITVPCLGWAAYRTAPERRVR